MTLKLPESGNNGLLMPEPVKLREMIDANKRTWRSAKTGQVFQLKPVSVGLMNKLRSDRSGRPAIPMVRVHYGNEQYGEEANPNDPVYIREYADWQTDWATKQAVFVISSGVVIDVPDEFRAEVAEWDQHPTPAELKYYYITMLIGAEEAAPLMSAILGQTAPTEEGIADASAAFPDARER